jgi:hypothetical protein
MAQGASYLGCRLMPREPRECQDNLSHRGRADLRHGPAASASNLTLVFRMGAQGLEDV